MRKFTLLFSMFLVMSLAVKAATYSEDFELLSKTAYSSATVTLTGSVEWNFTGSNAGNGTNDWKIGGVSARLAGTTKETSNAEVSKIEMLANKSGGIGNVTFQYRQYGTDPQIPWFVQWSSDGTAWTQIGEITATADVQTFSYDLNQANARIRILANGFATSGANGKRINVDNLILTDNGGASVSQSPIITPATGNIYSPITITITAAEGASIYYTTNGSEPTNASTAYTAPFNVSATTTVKAIAYETGKNPSSVATATYTLVTANTVANIAALRAITLPSTEAYKLTGEAMLTFKTTARNAKYIQDATGAVLIDDASGKITTVYNVGDGITGIIGTIALYNGMLQFTPVADPGAATSTGNTVAPQEVTISQLSTDYQAELVFIKNVAITETGTFVYNVNYNTTDASGAGVMRLNYTDHPLAGQTIPTDAQDITGVVLTYNAVQQLVPISMVKHVPSGLKSVKDANVWTSNGKVLFDATAGESVEIYNTVGQKLVSTTAVDGLNEVPVRATGVLVVKVSNRVSKVIL